MEHEVKAWECGDFEIPKISKIDDLVEKLEERINESAEEIDDWIRKFVDDNVVLALKEYVEKEEVWMVDSGMVELFIPDLEIRSKSVSLHEIVKEYVEINLVWSKPHGDGKIITEDKNVRRRTLRLLEELHECAKIIKDALP